MLWAAGEGAGALLNHCQSRRFGGKRFSGPPPLPPDMSRLSLALWGSLRVLVKSLGDTLGSAMGGGALPPGGEGGLPGAPSLQTQEGACAFHFSAGPGELMTQNKRPPWHPPLLPIQA